jgi:hypothetical protein
MRAWRMSLGGSGWLRIEVSVIGCGIPEGALPR